MVHGNLGCADACAGVDCGQNSFCTIGTCECEDGYTGEPCSQFAAVHAQTNPRGETSCTTYPEFMSYSHEVTAACCDDDSAPCVAGLPTTCTEQCSSVLIPMQLACDDFLGVIDKQETVNAAVSTCQHSSPVQTHQHPCMDIDGDGQVSTPDLIQFVSVFGRGGVVSELGDVYLDLPHAADTVHVTDLLMLLEDFGREVTPAGCGDAVVGEASEFLDPVVTELASSIRGGYSTYRLSASLHGTTRSLYSIEGARLGAMRLPAAYQASAPFGANVGGTSPAFYDFHPDAEYDSWLTVSISEATTSCSSGSCPLGNVGIDFGSWTSSVPLRVDDGAVFWMDPNVAPGGEVVVAQITVPTGSSGRVTMGMQGHSTQGEDWDVHQVVFTYPP
jgi:hypothetical protein